MVPRITGTVQGDEIPVKKGYYKYVGEIIFAKEIMTLDLYYDDTDRMTKTPLTWNGEYTLKNQSTTD